MVEAINAPIPLAFKAEHAAQIMTEFEALCGPFAECAFGFRAGGDAIFFLQPAKGALVTCPERPPRGDDKLHETTSPNRLCEQSRGLRDKCCMRHCHTFGKLEPIFPRNARCIATCIGEKQF